MQQNLMYKNTYFIDSDTLTGAAIAINSSYDYYKVSGGTTITSLTTGYLGKQVCLEFLTETILTHSTVLELPGGVDLTAVIGSVYRFAQHSATAWICISGGGTGGGVSDTAYGAGWDGITTMAPSKNAVYDEVSTLAKLGANADITSMTGLSDDGIPLAKVDHAASDGANSDITGLTALTGTLTAPAFTSDTGAITSATYITAGTNVSAGGVISATSTVSAGTTVNPAQGIKFPASQYASEDVNTLDDYEEGTWNPTLVGSTSGNYVLSGTYDTARYTKVGRVVHVNGYLSITSDNSTSGDLRVSLPFTSKSDGEGRGRACGVLNLVSHGTATLNTCAYVQSAAAYFKMVKVDDNGANFAYLDETDFDSSWQFTFNFSFVAA